MTHVVVNCGNNDGPDHENPVGERHVHLVVEERAGVNRLDVRRVGHSHDLGKKLERAGDHGLARDDGGHDGDDHAKVESARWHGVEEGVGVCSLGCIGRDEGRLANIGKHQAWVGETEPRELDGPLAKGAEVSEEGLHAGKSQKQAAE